MNLFIVLVSYGFNIGNAIYRGFVLKLMWGWFILSQFPSMPNISIAGALGISAVLELLQYQGLSFTEYKQLEENDSDDFTLWTWKRSYMGTLYISICLGIAAVIHHFM